MKTVLKLKQEKYQINGSDLLSDPTYRMIPSRGWLNKERLYLT